MIFDFSFKNDNKSKRAYVVQNAIFVKKLPMYEIKQVATMTRSEVQTRNSRFQKLTLKPV
jgi:hypothetical protein